MTRDELGLESRQMGKRSGWSKPQVWDLIAGGRNRGTWWGVGSGKGPSGAMVRVFNACGTWFLCRRQFLKAASVKVTTLFWPGGI